MSVTPARRIGADVRARLDHPVIDGDGHVQEADYALPDFLKQVGGADLVARWEAFHRAPRPLPVKATRWNQPSGPASIDRAMAMLPKLRRERNLEAGIDFAIVYTTRGLGVMILPDDELRQAGCRALNLMNAELFAEVKESMTPSALIPMNTPAEAIAELEYAVKTLGFKRSEEHTSELQSH